MSSLEVVDVLLLLLLLYCLLHCVSMLSGNGLIINGEIIRERERDRFPMCVCVRSSSPLYVAQSSGKSIETLCF